MFSDDEKILELVIKRLPMIRAALAAWKRCGTCGHGYVNVRMLLKTAVTKYANDPEFIKHCKQLMPLPCMLGGVLIK